MPCPTEFRGEKSFGVDYHQQYFAKNPNGYCGIGGCGVPFKLAELQVGEKAWLARWTRETRSRLWNTRQGART